jgi:hypothetical protein
MLETTYFAGLCKAGVPETDWIGRGPDPNEQLEDGKV